MCPGTLTSMGWVALVWGLRRFFVQAAAVSSSSSGAAAVTAGASPAPTSASAAAAGVAAPVGAASASPPSAPRAAAAAAAPGAPTAAPAFGSPPSFSSTASGGVGTDRNEMYLGFPGISLPPPATLAIPRLAFFERAKSMGTVKLALVAIDTKTKQPVINTGYELARADHRHWQVLGLGSQQSGSVQEELVAKTGEDSSAVGAARLAVRSTPSIRR